MPLARKLALFVYKLTHRRTGELLSPYLLDRLEGVRCFLEIILFCLLGLYIFWQWLSPTVVVRYRLTLYVAVGDQIRSGSGVLQVTAHDVRFLMPIVGEGGPWSVSQKGEAVAVDLGPRGLLVATLFWDSTRQSSRALDGLETLAASRLPDGGFFSDWLWEINLPTVAIDVPLDDLPMLVRFRDRADRQSAERVAPNDLARAFGADVRLVHATIEIVPHGYWPFNLLKSWNSPVAIRSPGDRGTRTIAALVAIVGRQKKPSPSSS